MSATITPEHRRVLHNGPEPLDYALRELCPFATQFRGVKCGWEGVPRLLSERLGARHQSDNVIDTREAAGNCVRKRFPGYPQLHAERHVVLENLGRDTANTIVKHLRPHMVEGNLQVVEVVVRGYVRRSGAQLK